MEIFASQGALPHQRQLAISINDIGGKLATVVNKPMENNENNISLLTPLRELEEKIYLYVNSASQRCSNKIFNNFLIGDFFHFFTGVSNTGGALLGYSGLGKLIHETTWKISWSCPFKLALPKEIKIRQRFISEET